MYLPAEGIHTVTIPEKSGYFRVTQEYAFYHDICGYLKIPVGFETNFASIPIPFRNIFNVNGEHREEAAIHDYLYSLNGHLPNDKFVTRKDCDKVFFDLLKFSGVGFFKRHSMYRAVRLFGGIHKRLSSK